MASKEVRLEVARFLDSPEARALPAPARPHARAIAEAFTGACYENLGKRPRLLDGQDLEPVLGTIMPAHFGAADPRAEHAGAILEAFVAHLESTQVVPHLFEIRSRLDAALEVFQETVRSGKAVAHVPGETFAHRAPKLGRNDPCSCGSGKKYKKCHGKPS